MNIIIMNMFIQKFINRKRELEFLNREYQKQKPFFIIIYGRRRVGKTELINYFIKNKEAVYFLATQEVEKENIVSLSKEIASFFDEASIKANPFSTFKQAMEYLKEKAASIHKRTIIVFDEFPYLVDANKSIPSILQKYWDEHFKNSNLEFILCGSSISAMESKVLGRKSPLYGRRTGQWKVDPLSFKNAIKFFPNLRFENQIEFYSLIGGIPLYLLELDQKLSLLENIKFNIAQRGVFLYEEPIFILKEELREPKIYFSLLKEISSGKVKLNDIKNALGVERTLLGRYIETLETLDFIEKQTPVTSSPKSKNTIYFLKDNFFRFWFKFIFPYKKELDTNRSEFFMKNIKKNLNSFIGNSFEIVCQEFLEKTMIFQYDRVGKQWGKIPKASKDKNQYEIDICALNEKSKEILFCECKWQDKIDACDVLNGLKEKAKYVNWHNGKRKEYYVIFAKSFRRKIKEEGIYCFDLKDLEKMS